MAEYSAAVPMCTLCKADGIDRVAASYCTYCKEYMCETCSGYHAKFRARRHEVLTGDDMPDESQVAESTGTHVTCPEHSDQNLTMYCPDHDAVCCDMCLKVHHRKCDVIPLSEAASGVISSQECIDIVKKIRSLKNDIQTEKDNISTDISEITTDKKTFMSDVQDMKEKIFDRIEELIANTLTDMKATAESEDGALSNNAGACDGLIDTLSTELSSLEEAIDEGDEIKAFIEIKRVSKQIEHYEPLLSEISKESDRSQFTFIPNEELITYIAGLADIGTIDLHSAQAVTNIGILSGRPNAKVGIRSSHQIANELERVHYEDGKTNYNDNKETKVKFADDGERINTVGKTIAGSVTALQHFSGKTAVHIGDYIVRGPDDVERCDITGCDFLNDGRLLMADHNNETVKIMDKDFTTLLSLLIVTSEPWDTAILSNDMAAVTLPEERKIQFLHTKQGLEPGKCISTKRKYWGIVESMAETDMLIVGCTVIDGDPQIHIIDMAGIVKRRIEHGDTGEPIFDSPYHLAHTGKQLLVSDSGKESIISLTLEGLVKHTYADGSLAGLNGIAIDNDGCAYVCGNVSHNVHQIGKKGEMAKELLSERDGLRHPQAVCVDVNTGHVVVSMYNTDVIKVFRLSNR